MVFILVLFNILLITFAMGVTWWAEEGENKTTSVNKFSGLYAEEFPYMEDYYFKNFLENATFCMKYMDNKKYERIDEGIVDLMVGFGYQALADNTGIVREEMYAIQKAYYVGYLGLAEEELTLLKPDEGDEYKSVMPDVEEKRKLIVAIMEKIEEGTEWE